ncbi:ImmA/IrrE family metallo-endopeptidase [Sulfitobacter alexandrii]|nr:ImmA/IrrE family metallo-endopeptidase [Sulfitobacter alexandrii]
MKLSDIHAPRRLGKVLHDMLGRLDGPVPILDIARALDVSEVRLDEFDGFEGMLLTTPARRTATILANTRYGTRRARFSVAHELGHFLLERHVLSDANGFRCTPRDLRETRDGQRHFRQEAEANQFAIEALAPVSMVKPFLNGEPDLRAALSLRNLLDISLEAAVRRILDLAPVFLGAVWSHNGAIRYLIRTQAFPFLTCGKGTLLPEASAAASAVANGKRGITEMRDVHSTIWTDRADIGLKEQTRVGKNGHAVTLLWADLPDHDDEEKDHGVAELVVPGFR